LDDIGRSLDVKTLRLLGLLLKERSVSKTALLLGQSQPSVSSALKRLRVVLDDPLLVRSGQNLVLTERGEEVRETVGRILEQMDRLLDPDDGFDPAKSQRRLRIAAANCFSTFLVPRLIEVIYREAPGMRIDLVVPPGDAALMRGLEEGELDAIIGNWPMPPENLRYAPLFVSEIACVVRAGSPLARREGISLAEYLTLDHLSPTPSSSFAHSPIDGRLAQLNLSRRIAVSVPEYALAPQVLNRTDLIFTTGRPFAEHLAQEMPFTVFDAPEELGLMNFYLLWHERAHLSNCNRWLRSKIRHVAREFADLAPAKRRAPRLSLITAGE
jgi:DNA-binding transcriptional LysR family regulator